MPCEAEEEKREDDAERRYLAPVTRVIVSASIRIRSTKSRTQVPTKLYDQIYVRFHVCEQRRPVQFIDGVGIREQNDNDLKFLHYSFHDICRRGGF